MTLAVKRIHNLPPHRSYVSTLPDITQKPKSLCCLPSNSVSGSEKKPIWHVSGSGNSRLCG